MPIMPDRLCACHGEPMHVSPTSQDARCVVKRRVRSLRYQATPKGRAAKLRAARHFNARSVSIGHRYLFAASTPAEAATLRAHITGRLQTFREDQRRSCAI